MATPRSAEVVRARLSKVATGLVRHVASGRLSGPEAPAGTIGERVGRDIGGPGLTDDAVLRAVEQLEASGRLIYGTDAPRALPQAHVIVAATSATGTVIESSHLRHGAVVCDVSRPANVAAELAGRPDVLVIDGGIIEVPGFPHLGRFGLDRGMAFACMAETMMLALDGHFENTSLGSDLTSESLGRVRDSARRHGFRVARLRSFGRLLEDADFERVRDARRTRQA